MNKYLNEYDNFGEKKICNAMKQLTLIFKIITRYSLVLITVNKNIFRTILGKIKINLIEFNLSHIILN